VREKRIATRLEVPGAAWIFYKIASAGPDMMKHIAAPMIGGIVTSFLLELIVYPAVYQIWKWNFEVKHQLLPEFTLPADANAVSSFR